MTLSTTSNTITYTGNGSNTSFSYAFIIPTAADVEITLTTIATGATSVLDPSVYSITGLNVATGGIVTYPLSGSPITSATTLTIQRIVALTQTTDLVNQSAFYPQDVESEFDYLTMIDQQQQEQLDRALAFPVGTTVDTTTLLADILNGAANAAAAAASATAAAASAASITALLPLAAANIGTSAVTTAKINANAVTPVKLDTATVMPGAYILNGYIGVSVAASALTASLLTNAGTAPSATDPVYVVFRSATAATPGLTVRTVTAGTTLVISSGSTLGVGGTGAANAFRLWFVLFDDSGVVRLGVINCLSSKTIYPLGQFPIASSTAEGGTGAADSAQVFYTGTAVTSKPYVVVAWMSWETGLATAAGNWDAVPTRVMHHTMADPLPGAVVQIQNNFTGAVATGTTVIPNDDTIPQITEGDQYMTQAITPFSAANLLRIDVEAQIATNTAGYETLALFQDATASALQAKMQYAATTGAEYTLHIQWIMLAALIVATTFRARAGLAVAGTTTFNGDAGGRKMGGVLNSYMIVVEIMT